MFGYGVGDMEYHLHAFVHAQRATDLCGLSRDATLGSVGIYILLDGARRCGAKWAFLQAISHAEDDVIHLRRIATVEVASTVEGVERRTHAERAAVMGTTAAAGAVGAAAGGSIAGASVTVLASHLGGAAL
jgi:hypothetical protein